MTPLTLLHREQDILKKTINGVNVYSDVRKILCGQLTEVDTLINLLIGPRRVNR